MGSTERRANLGDAMRYAAAIGFFVCLVGLEPAADARADTIETVVVTGEKTVRSLQDTPSSVAVIDKKRINDENIQNVFEVVDRTANMSTTYGPTGFTIRGISNTNVSGGGNGGLATVYVDDAPISQVGVFSAPLDTWDVNHVEVLRGPQSTLQGRNALAGAIIIRTQDPTMDWTARGRALWSDDGEHSFAFAGGGPIVDDELAFRVAVEDRHADGLVYNPTRHEYSDELDNLNIRGKLLWEPAALPGLEVIAGYTHNLRHSGDIYTYARTDIPDFYDHRLDLSDDPNQVRDATDIATLSARYPLGRNVTLSSVTTYGNTGFTDRYDGDLTAAHDSFGTTSRNGKTWTQELRLNYEDEDLSGLVGLYYSDEGLHVRSASLTNVPTPTDTLAGILQELFGLDEQTANDVATLYTEALPVIPVDYKSDAPQSTETMALFADGTYRIAPKLSLIGGFRYDHETYTLTSDQRGTFAGTYPDPEDYGDLGPVIEGLNSIVDLFISQASSSSPKTSRSFDAFLPKLGVTYAWTDDLKTSLIVQQGYRSGGSQLNIARSTIVPYDPEYTWNYELSLRSSWLDGRLTINANAFYIDWTDQQVGVNLGLNVYDYQTENAGKSHLYGFELELAHQVDDNLSWYASLGHTETRFDDFAVDTGTTTVDLSGSEFAYAPRWTVAAGATYRFGQGFMANVNGNYRSRVFSDVGTTQGQFRIAPRTIFNAKTGYEAEHWALYLYADNLFDERYIQFQSFGQPLAVLGAPRVVGASLETRW